MGYRTLRGSRSRPRLNQCCTLFRFVGREGQVSGLFGEKLDGPFVEDCCPASNLRARQLRPGDLDHPSGA